MLAKPLEKGGIIGIAAPSWITTKEHYEGIIASIEKAGYRVKTGDNLYAGGWGYAASDRERADDLNQLIRDESVRMIFFSGGEGAEDVLTLLDYGAAKRNPKLWCSYSDGTTLLDTIWARTGLVTYYGQMPSLITDMSDYNRLQFERFLVEGKPDAHIANSEWRALRGGAGAGTLIGGYLDNFIFLCNNGWITPKEDEDYLLFIEDHEMFAGIERESALLRRLELSPIMRGVRGLIFGNYSDKPNEYLFERLARLGDAWRIPVCYCDDFGHGANHAILPVGARARLNADEKTLTYKWR